MSRNVKKRNPLQVAKDMLHATRCNIYASLQKVEPSSTLCNRCKPRKVARQFAKRACYKLQSTCNLSCNTSCKQIALCNTTCRVRFYFCNDSRYFLNHCKLQPEIATRNISPTTSNGFLFSTL